MIVARKRALLARDANLLAEMRAIEAMAAILVKTLDERIRFCSQTVALMPSHDPSLQFVRFIHCLYIFITSIKLVYFGTIEVDELRT